METISTWKFWLDFHTRGHLQECHHSWLATQPAVFHWDLYFPSLSGRNKLSSHQRPLMHSVCHPQTRCLLKSSSQHHPTSLWLRNFTDLSDGLLLVSVTLYCQHLTRLAQNSSSRLSEYIDLEMFVTVALPTRLSLKSPYQRSHMWSVKTKFTLYLGKVI